MVKSEITPAARTADVEGSGTTAIPHGLFKPEIKDGFTVAPEVVYTLSLLLT